MTIYMDTAQTLLTCYDDALNDPAVFPASSVPGSVCLRHGESVAPLLGTLEDECCSGLAWVRIVRVEPLRTDDALPGCLSAERRVTLEMGAAHCLPWGTLEAPPTCQQWTDVALLSDDYHNAMEAALCCLRTELGNDQAELIRAGDYVPTGPDANCIGGTMEVIVETSCTTCGGT